MQHIIDRLGLRKINDDFSGKQIKLLTIANPDCSIRWFWPSRLRSPLFLKFYNTGSFRAKLYARIIQLVFLFRLQSLVFKTSLVGIDEASSELPRLDLLHDDWAVFTGTIGPNNKAIVYGRNKQESQFYKIATTEKAKVLLGNEFETLNKIQSLKPVHFSVPVVKDSCADILVLSDVSVNAERTSTIGSPLINALAEIADKTTQLQPLQDSAIWQRCSSRLSDLRSRGGDKRIPPRLLDKLQSAMDAFNHTAALFSLSHGDLTPWNLYVREGQPVIYDWELSDMRPLGFDAFHFVMQQGILIEHQSWKQIKQSIHFQLNHVRFGFGNDPKCRDTYLMLYLIINTIDNLYIYASQPQWHVQVNWLLNTWNIALTDLEYRAKDARSQVIGDMFDYLHNEDYAALKFPDADPASLSVYADIDLCLSKPIAQDLVQYLGNHPKVAGIRIQKKSFMTTLALQLIDGKMLHLDLLWKLKRKSLVMMPATDIIRSAKPNAFGVKLADQLQLARFVGWFYGLNHAMVPEKYAHLKDALGTSVDDLALKLAFTGETNKGSILNLMARKTAENTGIKAIINRLEYVGDLIFRHKLSRGMIITFSGVDGAGKSTMIEKVRNEFEKKHRRRVIVIRHRPSMLPILSVWTKGKARAEKEAAAGLPRQGTNKSRLSSLMRFAYYYADYLFGQFYVQLRYVLGGYVVLYDRYYFDFINDSERSNIQLPESYAMAGYQFLIKPEFNFFLYADPEVILSRKRELSEQTIVALTTKYLRLFDKLSSSRKSQFIPIRNVEMETTLQLIMNKTLKTNNIII